MTEMRAQPGTDPAGAPRPRGRPRADPASDRRSRRTTTSRTARAAAPDLGDPRPRAADALDDASPAPCADRRRPPPLRGVPSPAAGTPRGATDPAWPCSSTRTTPPLPRRHPPGAPRDELRRPTRRRSPRRSASRRTTEARPWPRSRRHAGGHRRASMGRAPAAPARRPGRRGGAPRRVLPKLPHGPPRSPTTTPSRTPSTAAAGTG